MTASLNGTCMHLIGCMKKSKANLNLATSECKKGQVIVTGNYLLQTLIQKYYLYRICDIHLCLDYTHL